MSRARDRRQIERRAPKRGVTIRHDDLAADEKLGSKRHRRARSTESIAEMFRRVNEQPCPMLDDREHP